MLVIKRLVIYRPDTSHRVIVLNILTNIKYCIFLINYLSVREMLHNVENHCLLKNVKSPFITDFTDFADYWMFPYESASLRFDLEDVWEEIRPLYEQLHAYVRRKLRDLYGPEKISRQAPLPAHILGRSWTLQVKLGATARVRQVEAEGPFTFLRCHVG